VVRFSPLKIFSKTEIVFENITNIDLALFYD
jgi:hypothetical protein